MGPRVSADPTRPGDLGDLSQAEFDRVYDQFRAAEAQGPAALRAWATSMGWDIVTCLSCGTIGARRAMDLPRLVCHMCGVAGAVQPDEADGYVLVAEECAA